jgi:hypothetical protein
MIEMAKESGIEMSMNQYN